MRLVIDVTKDARFIEFAGHEIEIENVPEDRQWKIDELREERDSARKEAEVLRVSPPTIGVSPAVATEVLRDILAGRVNEANKINCIKFVRTITGLGLKESKDLVDTLIPVAPRAW